MALDRSFHLQQDNIWDTKKADSANSERLYSCGVKDVSDMNVK